MNRILFVIFSKRLTTVHMLLLSKVQKFKDLQKKVLMYVFKIWFKVLTLSKYIHYTLGSRTTNPLWLLKELVNR